MYNIGAFNARVNRHHLGNHVLFRRNHDNMKKNNFISLNVFVFRKECSRENAGATVSDQQMRSALTPYPFDRYLVESRKQIDMVNIVDDDIWNSEPTLRPEDEIILRKLHDILQSTADDLKLLSGELSKYHESGVQLKTMPMPLDEEFNEKIHIEELVNAKFQGKNIVDEAKSSPNTTRKYISDGILQFREKNNIKNSTNASVKLNNKPVIKKQPVMKNLQISRTRTLQINGKSNNSKQEPDNVKDEHIELNITKESKRVPTVSYKEFSYKYIEPPMKKSPQKPLKIQEMPSISIRSDLKFQKVLQIDILPELKNAQVEQSVQNNALVIEMKHEPILKQNTLNFDDSQYITLPTTKKPSLRKISTMSAYESSESNHISSDSQGTLQKRNHMSSTTHKTPRVDQKSAQCKKNPLIKKDTSHPRASLNDWKKKLNSVYGRPINSKIIQGKKTKVSLKTSENSAADITVTDNNNKKIHHRQAKDLLSNTEYIPYSKLTLGGVNVSDVEREISNIQNNKNIVLSPILDKILSSRENSFHKDSPSKSSQNKGAKIFTTSDENLLEEVLDLETKVTNTLTNKHKTTVQNYINDSVKDIDSYADDFTDEKSEDSERVKHNLSSKSSPNSGDTFVEEADRSYSISHKNNENNENINNSTFTKVPNLSFKNSVDVFEYVHSVDTQETGTQSNTTNRITPKETQTSPRDDRPNVQPIHNDLWPSIDPRKEIQKMFALEKEFLKKLIIDEYGDLIEKNLNKPSTSGIVARENCERNVAAAQKNTQTSPAHVKSVMTSPTRTKTRPTSPFVITVNQQTSPISGVSHESKVNIVDDDLGISANLSSPRFSLRLPQTSREVISKLEINLQNNNQSIKNNLQHYFSSSSSADADYSSSDISSLGEINKQFKRLKKNRSSSVTKTSSSSSQYSFDLSSGILPLRSEGEASIRQINRRKRSKQSKSEGELSLGQMR